MALRNWDANPCLALLYPGRLALLLGLVLLIGGGCKKKGLLQTEAPEVANDRKFLKEVIERQPTYQTLALRGKTRYDLDGQSQSFSHRIHIRNGENIWASLSMFGLEGARAFITRDSVFVIDRLKKQYIATDFSYLQAILNLQVDFDQLEQLLIGHPAMATEAEPLEQDQEIAVKTAGIEPIGPLRVYQSDEGPLQILFFLSDETGLLTHLSAYHDRRKLRTLIFYSEYQPVEDHKLPYLAEVTLSGANNGEIEMQHKRIEVDPERLSFNFNIPAGYERIQP